MRRVWLVAVLALAVLGVAPSAVGQAPEECPDGTSSDGDVCRCDSTDAAWFAVVVDDSNLDGCLANLSLCDPIGAPDPCLPGADDDYDGDGDIDADDLAVMGLGPAVLDAEVARNVAAPPVAAEPSVTG